MHLRQPRFRYSACELFTKNKEIIQKVKETGDIWSTCISCLQFCDRKSIAMHANKPAGASTHRVTEIYFGKQQIAEELRSPSIRKHKVYSFSDGNILAAD